MIFKKFNDTNLLIKANSYPSDKEVYIISPTIGSQYLKTEKQVRK